MYDTFVLIPSRDFEEYRKLKYNKKKAVESTKKYMSSQKGKEANRRAVTKYNAKIKALSAEGTG